MQLSIMNKVKNGELSIEDALNLARKDENKLLNQKSLAEEVSLSSTELSQRFITYFSCWPEFEYGTVFYFISRRKAKCLELGDLLHVLSDEVSFLCPVSSLSYILQYLSYYVYMTCIRSLLQ